MKLYLAPHNDDEALWGAYTLMREKPLVIVITDSYIQYNRGENITQGQRWRETVEAMKILGCPVMRMGIRDDVILETVVREEFKRIENFETVYAPAFQGGNPQHDLVHKVAKQIFGDKCKFYTTYTKEEPYTTGNIEIIPTPEEIELKNKALDCYKTQIGNRNKVYFDMVRGRSEWFI